ncbi:MAG: hypothetical protein IPI72_12175 [Flavobacteriales bacterium]|nr:hypothetical protein [Flavobacteriales bacterium]
MDDKGNAYMVLKNKFSNKEVVEDEVNFEIKLVRISAEGVVEANVDLGRDVFPSSAILQGLADDRIAFAGVYAKASDKKLSTLGNFITIFDSTMAFTEPMMLPFHEEGGLDAEGEPEEEPEPNSWRRTRSAWRPVQTSSTCFPRRTVGSFW